MILQPLGVMPIRAIGALWTSCIEPQVVSAKRNALLTFLVLVWHRRPAGKGFTGKRALPGKVAAWPRQEPAAITWLDAMEAKECQHAELNPYYR